MDRQVYKRWEPSEKEKQLLAFTEKEYELFKYKMLAGNAREIYESCKMIGFYECLHEYFIYHEGVEQEYLEKVDVGDGILEELYAFYLDKEYLSVETWSGIEEMLRCYATRQIKRETEK